MSVVTLSAALMALVSAEGPVLEHSLFGTYEFEIMGAPHRLYVCGGEEDDGLYWSVTKVGDDRTNEYTEIVGRDTDGVDCSFATGCVAEAAVFRLYGERHLQGYYRLHFDVEENVHTLWERYPELQDGQTGAGEEEFWNRYQLNKISPAIVANPRLERRQCLHPEGATVWDVPTPSKWRSALSSEHDRFFDTVLVSEDASRSCWAYEDVYGNTHLHGAIFGANQPLQWDGALVLGRWDDFTNPDKCYVGSQFMVMLDEDLALLSYQCEDKMTGRQILLHLSDLDPEENCPFEVENPAQLTQRENSRVNLDK